MAGLIREAVGVNVVEEFVAAFKVIIKVVASEVASKVLLETGFKLVHVEALRR